jgi:hypothetical protein
MKPTQIAIAKSLINSPWLLFSCKISSSDIQLPIFAFNFRLLDTKFVRVTVEHDDAIYHVSAVIGWIYFVAWSVSFYPQIYENWKRKR